MSAKEKQELGKVLVIGGCGFLGHNLVNQLCDSYSSQVSVIDLRTNSNRRTDSDGVKYYDCNITDEEALTKVFEEIRPDVVIHTASPHGNDNKASHPLFYKVNVGGTKNVIAACRKTDVKALVYTSSASVISNNRDDLINADERWPILRGKAQTDYYSETKAHADTLVIAANRVEPYKLLTCSIRPAGLFGEGDPQLIPGMLQVYYNGKTGFQLGENNNLFDYTYVGNVAHAHILAAIALLATSKLSTVPLDYERVDGEGFLITNGTPIYFWDMARMIWREAGSPLGTDHVWTISKSVGLPLAGVVETVTALIGKHTPFTRKAFTFSSMTRYYNISKARQRLGYKPLWSLQEGVARSVKWAQEKKEAEMAKKGQ
jgi:sterol-4alpha-carboxylate 3-dehydrogenase (decarboxylating)